MAVRYILLALGIPCAHLQVLKTLTPLSAQKLGLGQFLAFPALLTSHEQSVNCYVMCDGLGKSLIMFKLAMSNLVKLVVCKRPL